MIPSTYLNLNAGTVAERGGQDTSREIAGQPHLWLEVFALISSRKSEISAFWDPLINKKDIRIILTGAGSSAFLGEAALGIIQKNTGKLTQSIATTDLVTHPEMYFVNDVPTILVSFGRSGNSPESVETLHLANEYLNEVYHLIITCNAQGALASFPGDYPEKAFCLLLPEEANDKSLAMTGSFTSMLLSILLISNLKVLEKTKSQVEMSSRSASEILHNHLEDFMDIASFDFERAVFLGSGPMLGIARECQLKLQELSDGKVICKHDSFLGFRHGPRVVLGENCLAVYLFSTDPHVYRYEKDLAESIALNNRNIVSISFGAHEEDDFSSRYSFAKHKGSYGTGYFEMLTATLIGQLLGFYKSLQLGLQPDNPSVSGAISRVVKGVNIYKKQRSS